MRVESIVTSDSKLRYLLVNDVGDSVEPVLKYLKYKDNTGAARNTLRAYCYHLKLFFEYLEQEQLDYQDIVLDEMAAFMRWLQNPYGNNKVSPISSVSSSRTARTINLVISDVISFYDYIMRHEDYSLQLSMKLKKQISGSHRGFKDFLYHIKRNKSYDVKILKLKVPKQKPKTITKEKIDAMMNAVVISETGFLFNCFGKTQCVLMKHWLYGWKTLKLMPERFILGIVVNFPTMRKLKQCAVQEVLTYLLNL